VDNEADFALVSRVYEALYPINEFFLMQDILEFLAKHPEVTNLNQSYVGFEGYEDVWFPERSGEDLGRSTGK
jgi:spore coat polysaccharide biosynthesis protein SpsF